MKIKSYLLLILIIVSAVALSVCSYVYTPEKYQEYSVSVEAEPVMAPLLKGASAGVFPWTKVEKPEEKPVEEVQKSASEQKEEKQEAPAPKT